MLLLETLLSPHNGHLYLLLGDLKSLANLGGPNESIKFTSHPQTFSRRNEVWRVVDIRLAHEKIVIGWLKLFKRQYLGHIFTNLKQPFIIFRLILGWLLPLNA